MVASGKNSSKPYDNHPHNRKPNPTQEEIRNACKKMQEDWDEREYLKRAGMQPLSWDVPTTNISAEE